MKNDLHQRVLRIWLTAILQSNLTNFEIRKLSDSLTHSPELFWEFSEILRDITLRMDSMSSRKAESYDSDIELVNRAYGAVKSQRLSKRNLFKRMESINRIATNHFVDISSTIQEMLLSFFKSVTPHEMQELLDLLNEGNEEDPYLKGINRKR